MQKISLASILGFALLAFLINFGLMMVGLVAMIDLTFIAVVMLIVFLYQALKLENFVLAVTKAFRR